MLIVVLPGAASWPTAAPSCLTTRPRPATSWTPTWRRRGSCSSPRTPTRGPPTSRGCVCGPPPARWPLPLHCCLSSVPSTPSLSPLQRAWVFERAVGYLVEGHDDRVIAGVASRRECEELCLLGTGQFRTQWCLLNSGVFTLCLISMQWGRLARYIEFCWRSILNLILKSILQYLIFEFS